MTALLSLRQFSVVRGEPLIDSFELTVAAGGLMARVPEDGND